MTDPFAHAARGFRLAATGFRLAVFTTLGAVAIGVLGPFLLDALFDIGRGVAEDLVRLLLVLLAAVLVAGLVLMIVGRAKALAAPGVARGRQACGAIALTLGGFGLLVAGVFVTAAVLGVGRRGPSEGLLWTAGVLWGLGDLFFLFFAKGVAVALRGDDLVADAAAAFRSGMLVAVIVLGAYVLGGPAGWFLGAVAICVVVVALLLGARRYRMLLSGLGAALQNQADQGFGVAVGLYGDDPDDDPGW